MQQRLKEYIRAAFFLIFIAGCLVYLSDAGQSYIAKAIDGLRNKNPALYEVVEFADGDTISVKIGDKTERIRFIGIDTPEKNHPEKPVQCFAQAASDFTRNLIGDNKVRLEADPRNTNRDRYDRLLRYVYLPDGTNVNEAIVAEGYGFAYTAFPYTKSKDFLKSEMTAREEGRGLWGGCDVINDNGYFSTEPATN